MTSSLLYALRHLLWWVVYLFSDRWSSIPVDGTAPPCGHLLSLKLYTTAICFCFKAKLLLLNTGTSKYFSLQSWNRFFKHCLWEPAHGQLIPGLAGSLHHGWLVQQQPWISYWTGCAASIHQFSQSRRSLHPVSKVSSPSLPQEDLTGTGQEVRTVPWWW